MHSLNEIQLLCNKQFIKEALVLLRILPVALAAGTLAGILCCIVLKDNKRVAAVRGVFISYLILLVNRVWFIRMGKEICGISLVPFSTINSYLHLLRFVLNIILFIPIGAFFPQVFPKSNIKTLQIAVAGLGLSLVIETVQGIFMLGHVQTDDVIANVCGAMAGYGLYRFASEITEL